MANNETRKTGVYGMKDLPKLKRKSGPLPPTRGFQQLGEKRTTGRDGLKRLKTIIEDELTDEDTFMVSIVVAEGVTRWLTWSSVSFDGGQHSWNQ